MRDNGPGNSGGGTSVALIVGGILIIVAIVAIWVVRSADREMVSDPAEQQTDEPVEQTD